MQISGQQFFNKIKYEMNVIVDCVHVQVGTAHCEA